MSTKQQREEDLEWLKENHEDFIKYYPATRRAQLSNLKHYSVVLMRKGKAGPPVEVVKPKKKKKEKKEKIEITEVNIEEV